MVNYASAVMNVINVILTLGLLFYALRIRSMFKGGFIGKTTPIFASSVFFLFLAAVFRAALLWGYFQQDFEPLEIGTRTIGFILLFVFAYSYAHQWATLGGAAGK
ncbi:MAG: hypothetical protein ABSG74_12800 [Candidatus Bathyarchaeia archaeon]